MRGGEVSQYFWMRTLCRYEPNCQCQPSLLATSSVELTDYESWHLGVLQKCHCEHHQTTPFGCQMVEQLLMSCPFPNDKGLHLLSQTELYLEPILGLLLRQLSC